MPRSTLAGLAAIALACTTLVGCTDGSAPGEPQAAPSGGVAEEQEERVAPLRVSTNLRGGGVDVDEELKIRATGGTLRQVRVTSGAGQLAGRLSKDGGSWAASGRLEPGQAYAVRTVAERSDGKRVVDSSTFRTDDLTLDQQTFASVAPLQGETVGVGMPVVVTFDVPVTDKASMERNMHVDAAPAQPGAWHWLSDYEAHWRPKSYWKAGTDVSVDLDINSVDAGNGIYGQESRTVDFSVGDAHVYKVDMDNYQMRVLSNGELLRTIPITTGEEPAFTTRSGVKVIMEKFRERRMNSETVGIGRDDPEYYNIADVEYAMRVTYSGEFIHAAPWSVGSQGNANVSHGCTGMSTADAAYLYNMTLRGDVVEYTGTDRPMTLDNGYGDWNLDFATWKQGSALS
jgi:lipoprotein-anchoring transpeptidase ErfK/SrfK